MYFLTQTHLFLTSFTLLQILKYEDTMWAQKLTLY